MKKANLSKDEIKNLVEIMKSAISIELHVEDFEPVRKFYSDIGFEILFDSPGNYLTIRIGKALLSFWGDGGRYKDQPYFRQFPKTKSGYDTEIVIPVESIDKYYNTIKDKVNVVTPLKLKRWGANDFRIEDPNGYYIRFTEPHDWIFDFEGYLTDEDS